MRLDRRDSFSTTFAATDGQAAYSRHVNPQWMRLLDLLELNAGCVECIHSIHPAIFGPILREIDRQKPVPPRRMASAR